MGRIELGISREMPVAGSAVIAVANDPATYPKWVAPLRSLQRCDEKSYVARVGYLFCERTINCTWTQRDPEHMIWDGENETLSAHLELVISPAGGWTRVRFIYQMHGESPLPGLAPTDEIAGLLLRGAAEYSLARLEKLAIAVERFERQKAAVARQKPGDRASRGAQPALARVGASN